MHAYEFWSWIPTTIIFIILLGIFAHSGDFVAIEWSTGTSELGSVLSYGSVIYGFATGWTSYAADYTVYQPSTQSRKKVFLWTWLGLIIPLLFTQMLGVAVMSATALNDGNNRYQEGYTATGTGGLLGAVLIYHAGTFGKFCMIIFALSIVANNVSQNLLPSHHFSHLTHNLHRYQTSTPSLSPSRCSPTGRSASPASSGQPSAQAFTSQSRSPGTATSKPS